jgi:thioglycine synthase
VRPAHPPIPRGERRDLVLRKRRVRYSGDGLRSVPLAKTLAEIERYFLTSGEEIQFEMKRRASDGTIRSILEHLAPAGASGDERYFGKGADGGQARASACMEFVERLVAKMGPDDVLVETSYAEVEAEARDPRLFCLSDEKAFDPGSRIDWCWGFSLTRAEPTLVPANLVFFPYTSERDEKAIAWTDSNGLASGNNLEEAILHAVLEVVERDAVVIAEYNPLPITEIGRDSLPPGSRRLLADLEAKGVLCSFATVPTDIPIPVVSAFLRKPDEPGYCSVAFGCHLDPALAVSRSLTEAVQLLPPSANHEEWLRSGSPERYQARTSRRISLKDLDNLASSDLRENIERCVAILRSVGSDIIVVDLSRPDVPFPVVRVLATGLQPLFHKGDMRLSPRFFNVPVRLGLRARPLDRADVKLWPLCGYR